MCTLSFSALREIERRSYDYEDSVRKVVKSQLTARLGDVQQTLFGEEMFNLIC